EPRRLIAKRCTTYDDSCHSIPIELCKPYCVAPTSSNAPRTTPHGVYFSNYTISRNPRQHASVIFCEPEVAIRTGHYISRIGRVGEWKFSNDAGGRDPADRAREGLGKPQIPIRTRGNFDGTTGCGTKLGDITQDIDSTDPVDAKLCKPERAIRTYRDARRYGAWGRNGIERKDA